jgi:hypothetical protein
MCEHVKLLDFYYVEPRYPNAMEEVIPAEFYIGCAGFLHARPSLTAGREMSRRESVAGEPCPEIML